MSLFHKLLLASMAVLVGCTMGISDSTSGPKGGNQRLAPDQRWPEDGTYTYDLNELGCYTQKSFTSRSSYCVGLTDHELNTGCALESRKMVYAKNCGNDFEETNIGTKEWFGWDDRLEISCSTALRSTFDKFAKLSDYCQFLKDEAQHKLCHWDQRQLEFSASHCEGSFSDEPPRVHPTPPPPPTPTPMPTLPTGAPDYRPQIARDLEAAGISIIEAYPPGRNVQQPSFGEQLENFYKTLELLKPELIARRQFIKEIRLSFYTNYRSLPQSLNLDIYLAKADVSSYLLQLDRRIQWETSTGIKVNLGIEVASSVPGDKLVQLKYLLQILEANTQALQKVNSLVHSLELADSNRYSLFTRNLSVDRNYFEKSLAFYIQKLNPLGFFFKSVDSQQIKVDSNFDFETQINELTGVVQQLEKQTKGLESLHKNGRLDSISMSPNRMTTTYFDSLKKLSTASAGPELMNLDQAVQLLALSYENTLSSHLALRLYSETLDANFITSAGRLNANISLIRMKTTKIRTVLIGAPKSGFMYDTLTVGATDSEADLQKVLSSIQR